MAVGHLLKPAARAIYIVSAEFDITRLPAVVVVSPGGSCARGETRPESVWDFGLYYRRTITPDDIGVMGYPGHVVAPGQW